MVLDVDKTVSEIAGHILTHPGHKATFAADPEEAVKLFRETRESGNPFDLVILDLTTAGSMDSKQAIVEIRPADPSIRALVASGFSNDPDLADCAHYGFDGVVTRPYNVDGLSQSISLV